MTPSEIIARKIAEVDGNAATDIFADEIVRDLCAAGFAIVPVPEHISLVVPGVVSIEWTDTPENRAMVLEVEKLIGS